MSFDYCTSSNRGLSSSADGKLVMWKISELGVLKEIKTEQLPDIGVGCVRSSSGWEALRCRLLGCEDSSLWGSENDTIGYSGSPIARVYKHFVSIMKTLSQLDQKDKTISVWSVYKDIS